MVFTDNLLTKDDILPNWAWGHAIPPFVSIYETNASSFSHAINPLNEHDHIHLLGFEAQFELHFV